MKKLFITLLYFSTMFLVIPSAFTKSPKKVSSSSKEWPIELKAEITGDIVKKNNYPILQLNLSNPSEATIKVLEKSFAADPAIWKFLVRTQSGKNVKIDYDAGAKVWVFKREHSKQYTVFVSKRKNNIESIQWLWFDL